MGHIMQRAKTKMKKVAFVASGLVVGATGLGLSATTMASADSWSNNNDWNNNNWSNNNNWGNGWNNSWNNDWNNWHHRHDHRFFERHVFDRHANRVVIIFVDVFTGRTWTQW